MIRVVTGYMVLSEDLELHSIFKGQNLKLLAKVVTNVEIAFMGSPTTRSGPPFLQEPAAQGWYPRNLGQQGTPFQNWIEMSSVQTPVG